MIPLITGFAVEMAIALGLYKNSRSHQRRAILILGAEGPVHIPIVDRAARWAAGDLNRWEERIASRLIACLRKFANTKAFEHLIRALINRDSRLRRGAKSLRV